MKLCRGRNLGWSLLLLITMFGASPTAHGSEINSTGGSGAVGRRAPNFMCVAHFDNSAENPANPDPIETVRWGDQTWEEMMIGWCSDALPREASEQQESKKSATDGEVPKSAPRKDDKPAAENAPTAEPETAKSSIGEVETGRILKRTYEFEAAGKEMEFSLYVPKSYNGSKSYPLIVALHGLYSNPGQILRYPGFTDHADEHGYVLVAPMGYNSRGWYGSRGKGGGRGSDPENLGELSEQDVMNVLELTRKELKIDDRRIYLLGHSMGGGGSLHLAIQHPEIWAAIAPIAPAVPRSSERLARAKHIPAIVVQGDKDRLVHGTRKWVEAMKELDIEHQYIEVKGGGHIRVAFEHFDEIFGFFNSHTRSEPLVEVR